MYSNKIMSLCKEERMQLEDKVDVAIFGGGVAGLWTLDQLTRRGYNSIIIERTALGDGQTIKSQGILHTGGKYALANNLSLKSLRVMKEINENWKEYICGRSQPDLSEVKILSNFVYFWISKNGNILSSVYAGGLRIGTWFLNARFEKTRNAPEWLKKSARVIYKLNEKVIDTKSLLEELIKPHSDKVIYGTCNEVSLSSNSVEEIEINSTKSIVIRPRIVVLTAGEGNEELAKKMGIQKDIMQRRPLRQIMVKGNLPVLYGHCIDTGITDITITTHYDNSKNIIWNLGGKIAEDGYLIEPEELIELTQKKMYKILKNVDFTNTSWYTYDAIRAESKTKKGKRPSGVNIYTQNNVIIGWPTKLVLAPRLAEEIEKKIKDKINPSNRHIKNYGEIKIASYPWEK